MQPLDVPWRTPFALAVTCIAIVAAMRLFAPEPEAVRTDEVLCGVSYEVDGVTWYRLCNDPVAPDLARQQAIEQARSGGLRGIAPAH
jgi:hypothetical protein